MYKIFNNGIGPKTRMTILVTNYLNTKVFVYYNNV